MFACYIAYYCGFGICFWLLFVLINCDCLVRVGCFAGWCWLIAWLFGSGGFWFGFGVSVVYCFVFVVLVVVFCWVWCGIGLCTIGCGFRVLFLGFADMFGLVFCFSVFAVDARYCFVGTVVVCCWIVLPFMVVACFWWSCWVFVC